MTIWKIITLVGFIVPNQYKESEKLPISKNLTKAEQGEDLSGKFECGNGNDKTFKNLQILFK